MSLQLSNVRVKISWQRPTSSNGRILGYEVTYSPIGGVERALSASSESIILSELRELPCNACNGLIYFPNGLIFYTGHPSLQRLRCHSE